MAEFLNATGKRKEKVTVKDDKGDKSVNFEGFEWFVQQIRIWLLSFQIFLKTWAAFANYYLALNFVCLKTHYFEKLKSEKEIA